jgi:hypothetical protein
MDALRRLFGGGSGPAAEAGETDEGSGGSKAEAGDSTPPSETPPTPEEVDAEERARELELLRAEQNRLDDLVLRQQRYADRSWVPPSQGGPRRADDGQASEGDDR